MKQPICEAKNISKEYSLSHGQILPVLKEINLSIYPGEIVALIGPSGCGKSTFLRILSGLEPPTKGRIFYEGKPCEGLLPDTAMVFQSFALYPWMTVKENIALALKALDLSEEAIEAKVKEAVCEVGLTGFEDVYPKEISGGMKQRVGLARALVRNPSLLLMDEPFSALDAFTAEGLRSEMIRIWEAKDYKLSSVVLISHEISEVVYMADKIVVLGANPGHILNVFENNLPRPRDYRSTPFLDLMNLIHNTYYQRESPSFPPVSVSPLFPVGSDAILGLLRHIGREKGPCDLYKIAKETNQHLDTILPVAESAELLHFIEIVHQTALLTEIGKTYLAATHENRHKIWKNQLITIPLFSKVFEWIKASADKALSKQALLIHLSKELPNENADTQLKILLRWSHYAKLFKMSKKGISLIDG